MGLGIPRLSLNVSFVTLQDQVSAHSQKPLQ